MKLLDNVELLEILKQLPKDEDGWVRTVEVIKIIQPRLRCSLPTAYAKINKLSEAFEREHGKIRPRVYSIPLFDYPEYHKALSDSLELLDNLVYYLLSIDHTIQVDEFLVLISSIREEIKNGVNTRIEQLRLSLEQVFHVSLEEAVKRGKEIAEGQSVPKTEEQKTEEPEQVFRFKTQTSPAQTEKTTQTA